MNLRVCKEPITVGVFSSSSPISATVPVRYEHGVGYLEGKGYRIVNGSLYGQSDNYRSGSIQQRADEFNQLLHCEDIQIVMAAIGGNNTNSILPYIDYEYLKQHPKVVVGYSDTTALLLAIYAKTGMTTFYGPALAASFGEWPPFVDETFRLFDAMMKGRLSFPYTYEMPTEWTDEYINWDKQNRGKKGQKNHWITVNPGKSQGRLIGGNLNTMEGFFGTGYMPEIKKGDILLLEDSLKDASTIERSFSLLKLAGVFDRVSGIILGKYEQFDDRGTGRKPYEILLEILGSSTVPILADFDCCHTHPMLTMPIGCEISLDATNQQVQLLQCPLY